MTTPAINTPYGIINDAYFDAALIQQGQTLNGEQLANGMRRLRDIINIMQVDGLKLFLNVDTAVPLTAGQAVYTFAPSGSVDMTKPLRVIQGYYLYTATNVRRPFTVMSWNDYLTLGQAGTLTSNRGTISQYFVDKLATQLRVIFWLCPDADEAANGQAHLLLQVQATNPTELDETTAFPEEWRIALRWSLADDLATGQPQAIMDRCQSRALYYRQKLEDWDVEDAPTRMVVDQRMSMGYGRFR